MVWHINPVPRLLSVYVCVYMGVNMCMCVYMCMYICVYVCVHICVYMCICVSAHVYVCVCICVCPYVDYLSLSGFWPQILAGEFHTREMCESWDLFADKYSLSARLVHVFPSESPQEADDTFKTEFCLQRVYLQWDYWQKCEGGNHGDGAVTLAQQWSWGYQLQAWGTEGGGCHCKLERRARQQWPSAEGPANCRGPCQPGLRGILTFSNSSLSFHSSVGFRTSQILQEPGAQEPGSGLDSSGGRGQAGGASGALEGIWRGKCTWTGKILHCPVDRDSRFCEVRSSHNFGGLLKENHTKISYLGKKKTKPKTKKKPQNKNPLKWLTEGFGWDMCLSLISFTVNLPPPMTLGTLT